MCSISSSGESNTNVENFRCTVVLATSDNLHVKENRHVVFDIEVVIDSRKDD